MILGLIGRLVKTILQENMSYMVVPGGEVYFADRNPWKRVPIYVHQPTKTVWDLHRINAWWRSDTAIEKAAVEIADNLESCDNLNQVQAGMHASGLLRIALEGFELDLIELGGKYFERTDMVIEYDGGSLARTSFLCLGNESIPVNNISQ